MSTHRQQTFLGYLFLVVGLALIAIAAAPTIMGMRAHPVAHVDVPLRLAGLGVAVSILGAWLIPNSGAGPVVERIVVVAGPILGRIPGFRPASPPEAP